MKKTIIIVSILFGLNLTTFADGGLFQRGYNAKNGFSGYTYFGAKELGERDNEGINTPMLPAHGEVDNQPAPMGSGIVLLMGLGAAYIVAKERRKE